MGLRDFAGSRGGLCYFPGTFPQHMRAMERLRLNRPIFAAFHDLFMAALSFVLSLYLRLGDATLSYAQGFIVEGTVLFTVISGLVFWRMGLYRALWRYASVDDLVALTKSVTLAVLIFVPAFFLITRLDAYPRSAALINWFVLLALLGGPRFVYRLLKDGGFRRRAPNGGDRRGPVLLVGASDQAELFIREMGRRAREAEYRVVAVVDDRAALRGAQIHGVRVMGRVDAIPKLVERLAERFESSYETVAHRLCNLSDPARRGLPMHFLRVDAAGNLSKRYSGDGIRLSHHEGSCPKLAVHLAFLTPSLLRRQYNRYPDGSTFFCFAKVVTDPSGGSLARGTAYSIGLGTHAENAKHLAYADDMPFADPLRQATPVGTTCRFCERTDCNMRSAPSYKRSEEHTSELQSH